MDFYIPSKYKLLVRICLIAIPVFSIGVSFFVLPPEWAVPLSIFFVIIPLLLSRFVFRYSALLIMPGGTDKMQSFAVGSCWFADDATSFEGLGLGLVYKYKDAARDAFQMLKAWNYGKYIDNDGNIQLSLIREGNGKYGLVIYPGERIRSQIEVEMGMKAETGPKSQINIKTLRYFIHLCLDYSKDKQKSKMVETVQFVEALNLNTAYLNNDEIVSYSKQNFRLKQFKFYDRNDSNIGQLEAMLQWENPIEKTHEHILDAIDRVRDKMDL